MSGSVAATPKPQQGANLEATRAAAELFVQMCMKGEVRLDPRNTIKITRADLPGTIRGWYKNTPDGNYYHIKNDFGDIYTIHFVRLKTVDREFKESCAVTAQNLDATEALVQVARALHTEFAQNSLPKTVGDWYYNENNFNFSISVRSVGNYYHPFLVLESGILNDQDRAERLKAQQKSQKQNVKKPT